MALIAQQLQVWAHLPLNTEVQTLLCVALVFVSQVHQAAYLIIPMQ